MCAFNGTREHLHRARQRMTRHRAKQAGNHSISDALALLVQNGDAALALFARELKIRSGRADVPCKTSFGDKQRAN